MAGKVVPHHLAVPAGRIVPHATVAAFAAPGPDDDPIAGLVDRLNGICETAGLGRPVLAADQALLTLPLDQGADQDAVLAALKAAAAGADDVLRDARLWPEDDPFPGLGALDPALDPDPVRGDAGTTGAG